MKKLDLKNVKELRNQLGMNQTQFWSKLGVTQSGGCRYEHGRSIPRPVQKLLKIAYGSPTEKMRVLNELA